MRGLAYSGDSILIAWSDYGVFRVQISSQRFSLDGKRVGDEQVLASMPHEEAYHPSAAALGGDPSGDFVVAWESLIRDEPANGYDIAARMVRHDGSLGDRIVLASNESADEADPRLQPCPEGFIATWTSYSREGADVHVRRFDKNAKPVTDDIVANAYLLADQYYSNVAVSSSGAFVVVWRSWDSTGQIQTQDGNGMGLYAQAFFSDDTRNGGEFQVSTDWLGAQGSGPEKPGIAFVNDTDFVITWDQHAFDPETVRARRFRLTADRRLCGDAVGADLTVRTSDALAILRSSVGSAACDLCSCDVDGSGDVSAVDAAVVLRIAVGNGGQMKCPPCR